MLSRFFLKLVGKVVRRPVLRHLAAFEAATHRPRETQEVLLHRILSFQTDTDFGRQHGFASIRSLDDYRRQLPVAGYEYFEPYIARVRRGELRALLADACVHMFALTSGTTAARKFIPVTPQYLADYRRGWNIWGMRLFRYDHPELKLRPIVQISSDWDEFRTEAGIPCGSVTGLTAEMQNRIIRWLYCVPGCISKIKDPMAKYYVVLRLSLPRPVGMVVAANPSTLVNVHARDRNAGENYVDRNSGTDKYRHNDLGQGRRWAFWFGCLWCISSWIGHSLWVWFLARGIHDRLPRKICFALLILPLSVFATCHGAGLLLGI